MLIVKFCKILLSSACFISRITSKFQSLLLYIFFGFKLRNFATRHQKSHMSNREHSRLHDWFGAVRAKGSNVAIYVSFFDSISLPFHFSAFLLVLLGLHTLNLFEVPKKKLFKFLLLLLLLYEL